jgi:hypothetical protein
MRSFVVLVAVLASSSSVSCAPAAPSPGEPRMPVAPVAPAPPPAPSEAPPVSSSSSSGSSSGAPAGTAAPAGPVARTKLQTFAIGEGSWTLHPMENTALLLASAPGGGKPVAGTPAFVSAARIEGERLVPIDGFSRGLPPPGVNWGVQAAHGVFPDRAYLELTGWFELETDIPVGRVYSWSAAGWSKVHATTYGTVVHGFAAVPGGGGVVLTQAVKADLKPRVDFRAFGKAKRPVLSRNGAMPAVAIQAFFGTPGGRLLVLGSLPTADSPSGPPVVEMFPPATSKGSVVPIPFASPETISLSAGLRGLTQLPWHAAPSDDVVYFGGDDGTRVELVKVEKEKLTRVAPPPGSELVGVTATADGALWVVTGSPHRLFERAAEGAWAEVELPKPAGNKDLVEVSGLYASSRDDLWVMLSTSKGSSLLHSRPVAAVGRLTEMASPPRKRPDQSRSVSTSASAP